MPEKKKEYYKPPEWKQKRIIANTDHWLRVHFENVGKKEVFDDIEKSFPNFEFGMKLLHWREDNRWKKIKQKHLGDLD